MWYYSSDGQQHGPLDETALDQLIATGVVTADTFVWKEGLSEWTPLGQLRTFEKTAPLAEDAKSSTCTMCGKSVGADNLIDLLGLRVCAACKPLAVQTFREGATPTANNTAWCDGKKVVTHNLKSLPPRCYKCNDAAAEPPLKRKLYWHSSVYYLLIFLNLFIYVVVAMIVRKRASVDVYLCTRHIQQRKYFIIGGWVGAALGIAIFIGGAAMNLSAPIWLGCIVLFLSIIVGLWGASLARTTRIKGDTVWLSGASKEFLASLPPWP
jgi:hypothetical protein